MPHLRITPIALILGSIFSTQSLAAESDAAADSSRDDIIISASRVETKRIESGSAVTVFDQQYLKENQTRSVAEILRDAPGVSVASNGGLGKKTSVFIRGASSSNTVVIIDGVKVTDHSSASGGFDFSHLMADNIERIEVLRGPQSALWGSDAMGGVINIVTKKGRGQLNGSVDLEFGGNKFNKQSINLNGSNDKNHYSVSASNLSTDGISTKNGEFDDPDDDGYKNQNVTLKAGRQFTRIFSLDAVMRYTDSESEYDVTGSYDDNYAKNRQRSAKINSHLNLLDNKWKNRLSLAYSDTVSQNYEPQGYYGPYAENSGDNTKVDLQSDYFLNSTGDFNHRFTLAAETEQSKFQAWSVDQEQKMDSSAVIGEYAVDWTKTVFLTASLRRDFNSDFDNTSTHKITLSGWANDGIRLHASQGTGVKNPTFSQLFGYYATPDLNPESSRSWDAGIEYNFERIDGYIDLTYFDADYDDAIRWDPNNGSFGGYVNQNEKSNGIELSSFVRATKALRINGQYTYMETNDGTQAGNELLRRPKHSASLNLNYKFTNKFSTNLGARHVGTRLDYGNIKLDSYNLVNIGANYQVHPRITVYGRIENAFDTDYVDITGYSTEPLTAYLGVRFQ
ncbi:TonB-dependent receptor domain-containing protein [Psychromonas aquimarina]|uniref:TonB-dependent receptor domain-containing protein n=1 Tax=Psychromonas aquimarina TaxID=444919 RepID=UPI000414E7A2|nr:TonB-dependent receptor [Psychromonas aquimarina]